MKVLVVGSGGREHALAWKISQSPRVEKVFCAPGNAGTAELGENVPIGAEDIPSLLEFAKKEKIGLTVVGPEAPLVAGIVDEFGKSGLKIFGPSKEAAMIEGSKAFAKEIMETAGVPTARYRVVSGIVEAQMHLDEFEKAAVKADGLAAGKGVFISRNHAEIMGNVNKILQENIFGKAGSRVVVEELLEGEEASILAFCDGRNVKMMVSSQDHKRAYDNDEGPNCYSEDTEILTESGWKTFDSVSKEEKVATFNVHRKEIEFQYPLEVHWMKHNGKMVHFSHRLLDLLVTSNHRMLVQKRKSGVIGVYEAQKLHGENNIFVGGKWNGQDLEYIELPEYDYKFNRYPQKLKVNYPDWVKFLALYLSEGYVTDGNEKRVLICQTKKSRHFNKIHNIISKIPFNFTYSEKESKFRINSIQLVKELKKFGVSNKKYIPDYIKNSSKDTILEFLKYYNIGDGDIHYGKTRFSTNSKSMAGDLQELIMKVGYSGVVTIDKRKTTINPLNGKEHAVTKPVYSIEMSPRKTIGVRKKDIAVVDYGGYVGCVTVPNSFVVVRRNNRVAISGNTGGMGAYSPAPIVNGFEERIRKEVMQPVVEELARRGSPYKGVLYAGLMIKDGNFKVLEFNARFGDPEAQCVIPRLENDIVDVFEACIGGKLDKTGLKWKSESACCVVIASGGYPGKYERGKQITGIKNASAFENVIVFHAGTKTEEGKVLTNGGRVLGIVGMGNSIREAVDNAYTAVSQINFGKMHFRNDIGKRALEREK